MNVLEELHLGCPSKLVSIRNIRNSNRKQFRHYPKQNICFVCFASILKQKVAVFRFNRNKPKQTQQQDRTRSLRPMPLLQSVLQQPVLPLDESVLYRSLCCIWTYYLQYSTTACASFGHICSAAACAALDMYVLQQLVLPPDVSGVQKPVLPWTYLFYSTLCCPLTNLFCSSLCCPWTYCNANSVYILLFCELRGLRPNFHIHVSVSDLYIPRIGPHISSSRKGRPIVGIYNSLTDT